MTLQASGAISLSQIRTEFGGSAPDSLSEYYRGAGLVPDISANSAIPTTGPIKLSDFYNATNADFVPNAINWSDITGSYSGNTDSQSITGINTTIELRTTYSTGSSGAIQLRYQKNGGSVTDIASGGSIFVNNGDTLIFVITYGGTYIDSSVVDITNQSDGGTLLDSLFVYMSGNGMIEP